MFSHVRAIGIENAGNFRIDTVRPVVRQGKRLGKASIEAEVVEKIGKERGFEVIRCFSKDDVPDKKIVEDTKIILKVVVLGDSEVGKTTFIEKIGCAKFNPESIATIGIGINSIERIIHGRKVLSQVMEIAGSGRFKTVMRVQDYYSKGAKVAIIIFDLTRSETFTSVLTHYIDALVSVNNRTYTLIIGNKADLVEDRQIAEDRVKASIEDLKEQLEEKRQAGYQPPIIVDYLETSVISNPKLCDYYIDAVEKLIVEEYGIKN